MSTIQVRHSTEVEIPEAAATRLLAQLLGHVAQGPGQPTANGHIGSNSLGSRRFSAEEVCRWFGDPESTVAPSVGQVWPGQGGVYAGIMRGQDGKPDHHLIVPTAPAAHTDSIAWGPRGRDVEGAKCEWDGRSNTLALYGDGRNHPAAEWAYGLEIDEHNDFYLPSRRELRLMWTNVPELFRAGWYWSSTQYSAGYAWIQNFVDGSQTIYGKDYSCRARAVRRLPI
ncbi:hypothetical protein [Achromobacter pestifer]